MHGAEWVDVAGEKERQIFILKRALRLMAETLVIFAGNDTKPEGWIARYIALAKDEARRIYDKRYPYDGE